MVVTVIIDSNNTLMPSYFFHVEFELYDSDSDSDSDSPLLAAEAETETEAEAEASTASTGKVAAETEAKAGEAAEAPSSLSSPSPSPSPSIYIPQPGTDIFRSKLPDTGVKKTEKRKRESLSSSRNLGFVGLQGHHSCRDYKKGGNGNKGGKGRDRVDEEYTEAKLQDTGSKAKNVRDWRFGKVSIESIDMKRASVIESHAGGGKKDEGGGTGGTGTGTARAGPATLGQFVPAETATTDVGWGVVHLYRDAKETPALENTVASLRQKDYNRNKAESTPDASFREKDCTTLCLLAVPSYMTSSDLLGFVGERTREDVSHFRLIRTARANKYMVLMKFRDAGRARVWQREWNGKLFNSMEVSSPDLGKVEKRLTFSSNLSSQKIVM